ncbi:oligosaccharide flippase family protein [Pontibacter ruber]|uniref:Oligosaccharide flippase family protein n=1 Tax=Pontibacter ruber TaxID=1343895 RepID=A0ABW5CSX2_9BACT|nr:oligosaccharide flippase family protein [Pontibacter ruber]
MSKALKDLAHQVSSNAIIRILGIVSVMIYTRYLVKEEIALIPFYIMMEKLSLIIFSLGILPTLVRDIPNMMEKNKQELAKSYIITSLFIVIPGILLYSILCYSFSNWFSLYFFETRDYSFHIKLMAVGFFFGGVNQSFGYVYWSLSRYQQESARMLFVGVIRIVAGIIFVLLWGAIGLIISYVISNFINFLIYTSNLKDVLFTSNFKLYPVKKLIKESIPFYLENFLIYFRAEGDQMFVAGILGPEAMAIYYIAKKPHDLLISFTHSLDKILTTSLAKIKDDINLFNHKVNSIITLNSFILFPAIFIAIGLTPLLITVIAGEGYEAATIPSIALLVWLIIQVSWKTALGKSLFILKSSMGRFKVTLIETISLFGLILALGNLVGLMGIVAARLLSTSLAGISAYHYIKDSVSINIDFKVITTLTMHCVILCVLLLLSQYFITSYLYLGLSFIFSMSVFLFLINRTISTDYYKVLNTVSPIRIIDPFNYLFNKVKFS